MIKRYSLPKMSAIWQEENKFKKMLHVEIAACEALAGLGRIPKAALSAIKKRAGFNVERIKEIEKKTNHDVVAFLMNLSENIGDEAKYVHLGMTSSDVLDTSLSIMMKEAADILLDDLRLLLKALRGKARQHKNTVMIGRSHGMHAEPTTFGLKMALFYDETHRNLKRIEDAREVISVGKISGAVGTYANVSPDVEKLACKRLDLKPANISTQILQRDRHAQYLSAIAITGASLEKFATEIRHLQRTEVGEVEEYFSPAQKGSSAMPHKKNPIICERICGLARVLRANAYASLENMPLWHERDISHSSVERVIIPDSTILLDYMLNKFTDVIRKLLVYEETMKENLEKSRGVIYSQRALLELIDKGLTRIDAYNAVQNCAMISQKDGVSFKIILENDKKVRSYLTREEIAALFDVNYHTAYVGEIFKKVGI
ncbi:MAG: adenylosuccinate lyase [Candidatus Omnitrophica bacterium]|nr:adenylosuccinate lyase [Candidatus Omnitrophota bacterium]